MWENTPPSTELPRDLCAGIGPLQLGVVLVLFFVVLFFSLIETLHDHILAKLITLLDQKNLLSPHGSPDFGSRKIITILIFLYPLQDQTVTRDY